MKRRERMVIKVSAQRLAHRTEALGLAWAALQILADGGGMAGVRTMVNALEKEDGE